MTTLNDMLVNDMLQQMHSQLEKRIGDFIDTLQRDPTFYAHVDGEEGDFGLVRYHDGVRTYFVFANMGGDSYDYYATEYGKQELLKAVNREAAVLGMVTGIINRMPDPALLQNINDADIATLAVEMEKHHPKFY